MYNNLIKNQEDLNLEIKLLKEDLKLMECSNDIFECQSMIRLAEDRLIEIYKYHKLRLEKTI